MDRAPQSLNMDRRSFALNYEVSLMLLERETASRMVERKDEYRRLSSELTLEEWRDRPARLRYLDNVFRLTSALQ